MQEFVPRPPFDENGFAVYEGQPKKKKSTPLQWIIPAGLLLIVAGVILWAVFRPREPEKFCRAALKDAITDSFAGGDPLIRELKLESMRKMLESKDFSLITVIAVQSLEAREGTGIHNLLDKVGMEPEDIPKGLGLSIGVESKKDQGFQARLGIALSSIQVTIIRLFGDSEYLTVTSPRLMKDGLGFSYRELLDTWYDNPGWGLVDEDSREETKNDIRDFLVKYRVEGLLSLFIDGNSPLTYFFGEGYDAAIDNLLGKIRFEEAKNASGRRVQQKFNVGGESVLCYGYNASFETEEICKRIRAVTGLKKEDFDVVEGEETIEAHLYITRRGELIYAEFSTELSILGRTVPVTLRYEASGTDDPQDHFTLTLSTIVGEQAVSAAISKNSSKNAYGVRSQWDGELMLGEDSYGITIQSSYSPKDEILEVTAKTFMDGSMVGGLEAEAKVTPDKEYEINFRNMKIWDTYSGTTANLTWKITVAPMEEGFSQQPPSVVHDVNRMTYEEWEAIYEEISDNLETYMDYLSGLF